MAKIKIHINNNKCQIDGEFKVMNQMYKEFAVRHPSAFHLRKHMPKGWDGKMKYISDRGYFKTGLLNKVYNWLVEHEHEPILIDNRFDLTKPKLPEKIGNLIPRGYQLEALKSVIFNKVGEIYHRICTVDASTNAGKTLLIAGIHISFRRKHKTLVLINDSTLFKQFQKELPELVEEDFGSVQGKFINWGNFTLAMVPTLARNIHKFKDKLAEFEIVLVDEADLADNKTYKKVLEACYNASVRVGLSGTIYMSKLAKHKVKNENLRQIFGDPVFTITKREMVDLGFSTEVVIKIIRGSVVTGIKGDFKAEYDKCITNNKSRHRRSLERTVWNIKRGRLPAIIVCQYHKHIDNLYKYYIKKLGDKYIIKAVHGDTSDKMEIIKDFRDGNIDILIASFIIRRGKNFPLLRYLQNAASSDSNETISQLMGRLERKHESKNKTYLDDLYDEGYYLGRHSRHRINYYKKEKFKVIINL